MQKNRAPNHLEGAQLVNLPNFEEVLQKKAEVYTKKSKLGGARPLVVPPVSATACALVVLIFF
jgi:hypothetical protein